ncbi:hypothetical protein [Terrabacter koreensis]
MRLVIQLALTATCALSACSSGGSELASLQVSAPNDLRLAALDAVGNNCESTSPDPDITGASYVDCRLAGVPVRFSTYPSEKQAKDGAQYYTGMGDQVHQEAKWVVAVGGDPGHLEQILSAMRAKAAR